MNPYWRWNDGTRSSLSVAPLPVRRWVYIIQYRKWWRAEFFERGLPTIRARYDSRQEAKEAGARFIEGGTP